MEGHKQSQSYHQKLCRDKEDRISVRSQTCNYNGQNSGRTCHQL